MREYRKILRNREARIVRRLRREQWCSQVKPMMSGGNIHYEMSGKAEAITCGGIGAFHHLVRRPGRCPGLRDNAPLALKEGPDFSLGFSMSSKARVSIAKTGSTFKSSDIGSILKQPYYGALHFLQGRLRRSFLSPST